MARQLIIEEPLPTAPAQTDGEISPTTNEGARSLRQRRDAKMKALRGGIERIPEFRRGFANSLLDQYRRKGRLSAKQWEWVDRLIAMSDPEVQLAEEQRRQAEARAAQIEIGDFAPVEALFQSAKASGLKWPKISLSPVQGADITMSVAGARAKVPGSINVTDGGSYGQNTWYGRVVNGVFQPNTRIEREVLRLVEQTLRDLIEDPLGVITQSGKKTGHCSCCGRKLDDPKSVEAGVGPICAKKFGLAR